MDFKTFSGTTTRAILNVIGGILALKFKLSCADLPASTPCDPADVGAAVGAVLFIVVAYIWSLVQKAIAKRKLEKAIAAPAGKAE